MQIRDHRHLQTEYPAPVAAAAWQVVQAGNANPLKRLKRLASLFEVVLKYACAILLGHYRQRIDEVAEVEGLLEAMRRPQLGHWQQLQHVLMATYPREEENPLVAELCQAFTQPSADPERLSAYREFCRLDDSPDPRNAVAYSEISKRMVQYFQGPFLSPATRPTEATSIEALLTKLLLDLRCFARYPLVHVQRVTKDRDQKECIHALVCTGTSEHWRPEDWVAQRATKAEHCYVCRVTEGGALVPLLDLHPTLVYANCRREGRRNEQVFVLGAAGQGEGSALSYLSYECCHPLDLEEADLRRLGESLDALIHRDQWIKQLADSAIRHHGPYLEPYLAELRLQECQPGYADRYRQMEQVLVESGPFQFPRPVLAQILVHYGVASPTERAPSIEAFTATPATIVAGATSVLEWLSEDAVRATLEPGLGEVAPSGSRTVSPEHATVYSLQVENSVGSRASATVTVAVLLTPSAPEIEEFSVTPEHVAPGGAATLRWRTQGATSVTISPDLGTVALSGECEVRPAATTCYLLQASNADGQTREQRVTVEVLAAPLSPTIGWFTAIPDQITKGQWVELEWHTQGADQVVIRPGRGTANAIGSRRVRPSTSTTYTLTASSAAGGSRTQHVRVEVAEVTTVPVADGLVLQWECHLPEPVDLVVTASGGRACLAAGAEGGLFFLGEGGRERWRTRTDAPVRGAVFVAERGAVVTADWNGVVREYDESHAVPRWEAATGAVVSALQVGRWEGAAGVFVATWRGGLFFCNRDGVLRPVAQTTPEREATLSALSVSGEDEECVTGDWEGAIRRYRPGDEPCPPVLLRQPVRAVAHLGPGGWLLALTQGDSFYALDREGGIVWLHESLDPVLGYAFAAEASACFYSTGDGRCFEIRFLAAGGHLTVDTRALRGIVPGPHVTLATDPRATVVVARHRDGTLTLCGGDRRCEQVPVPSPAGIFCLDPLGLALVVGAGSSLYAFCMPSANRAGPRRSD